MSGEGLLIALIVGALAGWIAGRIVQGSGFGTAADICIGIVGALFGSWALVQVGVHLGPGTAASIGSAAVSAALPLGVLGCVGRRIGRSRWR